MTLLQNYKTPYDNLSIGLPKAIENIASQYSNIQSGNTNQNR